MSTTDQQITRAIGQEIKRLKSEDPERLAYVLSQLSEEQAHAIMYDEDIWLRDNQQVKPHWKETVILFLAGRG